MRDDTLRDICHITQETLSAICNAECMLNTYLDGQEWKEQHSPASLQLVIANISQAKPVYFRDCVNVGIFCVFGGSLMETKHHHP